MKIITTQKEFLKCLVCVLCGVWAFYLMSTQNFFYYFSLNENEIIMKINIMQIFLLGKVFRRVLKFAFILALNSNKLFYSKLTAKKYAKPISYYLEKVIVIYTLAFLCKVSVSRSFWRFIYYFPVFSYRSS